MELREDPKVRMERHIENIKRRADPIAELTQYRKSLLSRAIGAEQEAKELRESVAMLSDAIVSEVELFSGRSDK